MESNVVMSDVLLRSEMFQLHVVQHSSPARVRPARNFVVAFADQLHSAQKEGPDQKPLCAKCYAAHHGPKGFRGGAVDGSVSVTEHKFDTASHVKSPRGDEPAAPAASTKQFCASCGSKLAAGAAFCPGCGSKA